MRSVRAGMVVLLLLVGMAAGGRRAHAESAEAQVERLAAEAVSAYKGADYNRAVELLTRAYEIRQVPALLYNMAKAYDRLGDVEHAAETYRRYADSADADPKLKAKADARLMVLEESRRKKAAAARAVEPRSPAAPAPVVAPPPAPVQLAPAAPPPARPLSAAAQRDRQRQEHARGRSRDRAIAIGLGVGALAFAGAAIGLSVHALAVQDQWSKLYGGDEEQRRSLVHEAQLDAALADGFYALTAVAAGVGAYFLYRGLRAESPPPPVALVPVASPTGGALVAVGHF